MAKIKYNVGLNPLWGKHAGSCFQSSVKGNILKNNARMRRFRSPNQKKISGYFISGTRHWRNINYEGIKAWQNFVEFLPQSQIRFTDQFLNAYQNFVKRSTFLQISRSDINLWMSNPILVEYEKDILSTLCVVDSESISLDCQFTNNDGNLDCLLFLSGIQSPGKTYIQSVYRYMTTIANLSRKVDITVPYIRNFGILPPDGSKLFFSVVFAGRDNGQFWFPEKTTVITLPSEPPFFTVRFGFLYNFHSIKDSRSIASANWRVPFLSDFESLRTFLGGYDTAGGKLKETDFAHWNYPNTGATNESNFNLRGAGYRAADSGEFVAILIDTLLWSQDVLSFAPQFAWYLTVNYNAEFCGFSGNTKDQGNSVRLIYFGEDYPDFYVGNDGKRYHTIRIGDQLWLAENLCETKFANGDNIPVVSDNSVWAKLTTAALCAYDNDPSNV
jgi:uncharacterized protein (TIGR02145 family)